MKKTPLWCMSDHCTHPTNFDIDIVEPDQCGECDNLCPKADSCENTEGCLERLANYCPSCGARCSPKGCCPNHGRITLGLPLRVCLSGHIND